MSMLREMIDINKPKSEVWKFMDLARWPDVTTIFSKVVPEQEAISQGAKFLVTAGPGEEKVKYSVEVTAYDEEQGKLAYERTGGPLPGTSEWVLTSIPTGTRLVYTNHYQHDLNSAVLSSIVRAMERFMEDLRHAIESAE